MSTESENELKSSISGNSREYTNIESEKTSKSDFEEESDNGLSDWLKNIERDALVSMEAARGGGLALMAGSTVYINEEFKEISEAIEDSLPEGISLEEYNLEQAEEIGAELEDAVDDIGVLGSGEVNELSELNVNGIDFDYIDPSEYISEVEEAISEYDPLIEQATEKLNTDVQSWEGMGIDVSENIISQLDPETVTSAILISFDKFAHLAIAGTAANFVSQAADRYTDRKSLIAAAGMSTAVFYAIAKEGFYEGGAGLQFDLDNLHAQADWIADTIGAGIGTWSYLKNRSKEQTLKGERDTGLKGLAARKAGRAYEKSKYLTQTNLPTRFFQYKLDDESSEQHEIIDRAKDNDLALVKYELDQTQETGEE